MVILPDRDPPLLGVTVKGTVPVPLPLALSVMMIQVALETAVQAQPGDTLTVAVPVPPAAGNRRGVAETEKRQVGVTPACVTVWDRPATVSAAVRGVVLLFSAIL
jgi:hypothetical protein